MRIMERPPFIVSDSLGSHRRWLKCIEYPRDGPNENSSSRSDADQARGASIDQTVTLDFVEPHQFRSEVFVELDPEAFFYLVFRDAAVAQTFLDDSAADNVVSCLHVAAKHRKPACANLVLPRGQFTVVL